MPFKLVFPGNNHPDVVLQAKPAKVGRDQSNDIVLSLPTVSSFHAELKIQNGSLLLVDLGSTNGTFLNGQPLSGEVDLKSGDRIHFDQILAELVAVSPDEPDPECFPRSSLRGLSSFVKGRNFVLCGNTTTIGRDPTSQIHIERQQISWHHATIFSREQDLVLKDLNSCNGTYVNGQRIVERTLKAGDEVCFGTVAFQVSLHRGQENESVVKEPPCAAGKPEPRQDEVRKGFFLIDGQPFPLQSITINIGRLSSNQIVLQNETVSLRHAVLMELEDGWWLEDLNSTNGTFVNGKKIARQRLQGGDLLSFGNREVEFVDPCVVVPAVAPSVVVMIEE